MGAHGLGVRGGAGGLVDVAHCCFGFGSGVD